MRAVDAQTDSGDVTADVGGLPRRVVARSNSGDVAVAVPRGAYRIRAIAESGDARSADWGATTALCSPFTRAPTTAT